MRLILVRHGQTTSNVGGLLDTGAPGADLTDLGRRQAAALPAALADERVEALWASTLVRTQQTAAPLAEARDLEVVVREGIREVRAGHLEMLGDDASVRAYLEAVFAWPAGDTDVRVPGGESGEEFLGRYDEVVAEVAASGVRTAVLVSHGAAIRAWTSARTDNLPVEFVAANPVSNTGAIVVEGSPAEGWTAVTWEGQALGGPALDTSLTDGPAGEPVDAR
ncbi:histidine phosphatase family protein [Georgenia thermotolerans]|uniref:Histidine phosphatase family protein n=1 Tax=Georgenia thermotolerans TaxID=527326 RepID=A0A7J5UPZ2_9MICO|nr:histidine phosphatase family protein [Georgenia thermotolerans]KAE8764486.1 histidine phosphatase family protein [Georgenia thermotolerans]